jgi:hypothetical protein
MMSAQETQASAVCRDMMRTPKSER